MRRLALLGTLLIVGCDTSPPQSVTVYVPTEYENRAREWLPQSGLDVTIVAADSRANTDRIIAKKDSPRADVLISLGVHDIWRAGDHGALRPLPDVILANIAPALKDPDRTWAAMSLRTAVISRANGAPDVTVTSYADLGKPEMAGLLCLASSQLPYNRALIGMLIEDLGVKPAERLVRRWVRNLAQAPFASEAELRDALARGDCGYAIISTIAGDNFLTQSDPEPVYFDIQGIGIGRHAEHPDAATDLVNWIVSTKPVAAPPPGSHNIGIAGWRDEEAGLLVERAGYW